MRLLITGGATGLGKSLALIWAKNHRSAIKICIADLNQMRGEATVAELESLGAHAFFMQCDIAKQDDITHLRAVIQSQWGGLDIIINNAGVASAGSLEGETIEQWQWVLNINLLGMVRICQTFNPVFKEQGHGYFINIASQAGLTPIPFMGSYNATKAAVVSFSETMKLELSVDNIDVSVVCPSFFKTHLDESMRTEEPALKKMMARAFEKSELSALQVANIIYQAAQKRTFLILTHKLGKQAYLMKKLLPEALYIKTMLNKTKSMKPLAQKR